MFEIEFHTYVLLSEWNEMKWSERTKANRRDNFFLLFSCLEVLRIIYL